MSKNKWDMSDEALLELPISQFPEIPKHNSFNVDASKLPGQVAFIPERGIRVDYLGKKYLIPQVKHMPMQCDCRWENCSLRFKTPAGLVYHAKYVAPHKNSPILIARHTLILIILKSLLRELVTCVLGVIVGIQSWPCLPENDIVITCIITLGNVLGRFVSCIYLFT
jgi:hypothetical protein